MSSSLGASDCSAASAAFLRSTASSRARTARASPSSSAVSLVRVCARRRSVEASRSRAASVAARAIARLGPRAGFDRRGVAKSGLRPCCLRLQRFGRLPRRLRLAREIAEPVLFGKPPRGGRRRVGRREEAVPAPEVALERDEPLTGFKKSAERAAFGAGDDADLREPARQRRGRLDAAREALDAGRQCRVVIGPARRRPVRRRAGFGRCVEIVAERSAKRGLIAPRDADRIDDRRPLPAARRTQQIGQRARLRLEPLRLPFGLAQRRARAGLRFARLRMLRLRGERLRLRCGEIGAQRLQRRRGVTERRLVGFDARQRRALALDRGEFAFEPLQPPGLFHQPGAERIAPRVEIGDGGLRLAERGFEQSRACLPPPRAALRPPPARNSALSSCVGERLVLVGEPFRDVGGIGDQRIPRGSRSCVSCSTRRCNSAARASARFSSPSSASRARTSRCRAAPARASASRKDGKRGGGDRLQARGLGLRARALGDVAHVGLEPPLGFGERGLVLAPGDQLGKRLVTADFGGKAAVARRLLGLTAQAFDLRVDLLQHVFEANEIVLRALQPQFRFVTARMQTGNARGFLEDQPARLRLGGNDLADLPLPHHRGRAGAGGGVGE